MKKISIIFLLFIVLSCKMIEYNRPKTIANDILSTNFTSIDSVFEANIYETSFYTDSVIKTKPSFYYKEGKDYFNKKYFLSHEGQTGSPIPEYIFYYKCYNEHKMVTFKFTKINGDWSLREMTLLCHY